MWETEHTAYTDAPPEAVWALWSDVSTWPDWDHGLERVDIDGPFAAGSSGVLKPRGGPEVTFTIKEVRPGEGFADETRLLLARIRFEHSVAREAGRTRITHRVRITGAGTPLFSRLIGRGIAKTLPETLERLGHVALERTRGAGAESRRAGS